MIWLSCAFRAHISTKQTLCNRFFVCFKKAFILHRNLTSWDLNCYLYNEWRLGNNSQHVAGSKCVGIQVDSKAFHATKEKKREVDNQWYMSCDLITHKNLHLPRSLSNHWQPFHVIHLREVRPQTYFDFQKLKSPMSWPKRCWIQHSLTIILVNTLETSISESRSTFGATFLWDVSLVTVTRHVYVLPLFSSRLLSRSPWTHLWNQVDTWISMASQGSPNFRTLRRNNVMSSGFLDASVAPSCEGPSIEWCTLVGMKKNRKH
jgi:hypothetical protein